MPQVPATRNVVVLDFQPPSRTVAWAVDVLLAAAAVDDWLLADRMTTAASGNCEMSITRPAGMKGSGSARRVVSLSVMPRRRGGPIVVDKDVVEDESGGKIRIGPSYSITVVEGI